MTYIFILLNEFQRHTLIGQIVGALALKSGDLVFALDQLGSLTVVVVVVLSFRSLCFIGPENPLWGLVNSTVMSGIFIV